MTRIRRQGCWAGLAAVSIGAHLAIGLALALNAPRFETPAPPPIYDVTIVPLYLPAEKAPRPPRQAATSRPLVPRVQARPEEPLPVAPLIIPATPARAATGDSAFEVQPDSGPANPPGTAEQMRAILRDSAAGCANAEAVSLSRREREACAERFGKGAKDAPFIPPPMSRDKRRAFDAAAARKEAYVKYKEGNVPPGVSLRDGGPEMKALEPVMAPYR
jgi:hypothetical protein